MVTGVRFRQSNAVGVSALLVIGWLAHAPGSLAPGAAAALASSQGKGKMNIETADFGKTGSGQAVQLYTLSNPDGMKVKLMTLGATLVTVETPDRLGRIAPVTLHLNTLDEYLAGHPCLGSVCGRFANRIAKGRFTLDGVEYHLAINNGPNHLHGGLRGFHKIVWNAEPIQSPNAVGVRFTYLSRDGEENYPGNLTATATYTLSSDCQLKIEYTAVTDRPTVLNLTNHAYWNLAGPDATDCLDHRLTIHADRFLPVDDTQIPLGELRPVRGTPMDFTVPQAIGSRIAEMGKGYDHCYVVNHRRPGDLSLAARVVESTTGRVMEVYTTQPGVQLYTANGTRVVRKSDGVTYGNHAGFCLETQHFPDAPNQPAFPSTVLRPGQTLREVTVHKFTVEK